MRIYCRRLLSTGIPAVFGALCGFRFGLQALLRWIRIVFDLWRAGLGFFRLLFVI